MKIKSILLYIIGVLFLFFGNKNFWNDLKVEKEKEKIRQKESEAAKINIKKKFEVQSLQYDSINGQWKNPHFYFQLINVSYVNFSPANKAKKTVIESNDDENASDSQ